jgi:hypothetical protein
VRKFRRRTPEFNAALSLANRDPRAPQPHCVNRWQDFDADDMPSEEAAAALCAPCPLLAICRDSARLERPEGGVMGGILWRDGKQFHWLEKLGHLSEEKSD